MRYFIFLLLFSFTLFAEEAVTFSKYETDHEILYFSSNLDPSVIDRLIADAERSEEFIKSLYGWVPSKKVVVVYDRETDTANGWSNSFMKNSIYLYIYPAERYSTLASCKNWEFGLHVHEYTHSTQIGQARGFPRVMNLIFGDFYFIGGTVPIWMLEGATVYSESMIDGKGRLNSPLYKSYFDSFFRSGNELKLGELAGVTDHWLGGNMPYLYGTFFYDYLAEEVGTDGLGKMFEGLSDDFFPFLLSRAARKSFGKSIRRLYGSFIEENRERVRNSEQIRDDAGTEKRFSRVFADIEGDKYTFFASNVSERALWSFDGKKISKINNMSSVDSMAERDGELLFTAAVENGGVTSREELFLKDKKGKIRQLTKKGSVLEASWGRDGSIFYISFRDGINRITHADHEGKKLDEWEFPELDSIYSLSFSPDGRTMAFTGNRFDSEKNIFLLDLQSMDITEINIAGDQYSVSFENDKGLVFSGENGRKIAPFRLDLAAKKVERLCEPGAVSLFPKVEGGKVLYIAFDNDGFFPASCEIKPEETLILSENDLSKVERKGKAEQKRGLRPAKGYEGMFPAMWYPTLGAGTKTYLVGASILGKSNDQMRSYDINYTKTFGGSGRHHVLLNYYETSFLPQFRVFFSYAHANEDLGEIYRTKAITERFSSGISLGSAFSRPAAAASGSTISVSQSVSGSLGIGGVVMDVKEIADPLQITPKAENDVILNVGAEYGITLNFNPGSRYLIDPMNNFSISLPLLFSEKFMTERQKVTLYPSMTLSFLLSCSGKVGFVTRNAFYMQFLDDSDIDLGGEETDTEIQDFSLFFNRKNSLSVPVRGYASTEKSGRHLFHSNNELVFHMISLNSNLGNFPLMFRNIQGAIFLDAGTASDTLNIFKNSFIAGTGVELRLLTYWAYRAPVVFTFGTAYGITEKNAISIYFNVGM